jgi:cytochrome c oxidase assembly protein subunit 19
MAYTSKAPAPKAPLKGAFPLDHEGDCKKQQLAYMSCLNKNNHVATFCREASLSYLECRMENNLMNKEPVEKLGFNKEADAATEDFNQRLASGDLKVKPKGR